MADRRVAPLRLGDVRQRYLSCQVRDGAPVLCRRRWRALRIGMLLVALLMLVTTVQGHAEPTQSARRDTSGATRSGDDVPAVDRATVLGPEWRRSRDRAWTTYGDGAGFHLMTAGAATGYRWRRVATLAEPGVSVDRWIGNTCITGSGRRAVVTYAPRTFTNTPELMQRGGFTAIVDLDSGAVRKLPVTTSLAYFNPACGAGEQVVLTQSAEARAATRVLELDARTGHVTRAIRVAGQLTSPVPTARGIVAADSGGLVRVAADGTRRVLVPTAGIAFKLVADADGGVVYMERAGAQRASVRRVVPVAGTARAASSTLATGPLSGMDVTSGGAGSVFVTGKATAQANAPRPASVAVVAVPAGARLSTLGRLAVTGTSTPSATSESGPVSIRSTALRTGRQVNFTVPAGEDSVYSAAGRSISPALRTGVHAAAEDPHDPSAAGERYCSVPRSDPRNQAMQPKPRQVEWAVDQAVRGALTLTRPANWKNLGMPAYSPQKIFPPVPLTGGGNVPAQVMLGVAAQESNTWQATRHAVPGVTSNPLIGNYFGIDIYNNDPGDDWSIDFSKADCGYGVMQVTDGMRLAGKEKPGETALPYQQQRAVGLDFAANIAAGLRLLQQKWNQTRAAGMIINNGNPAKIENWFFAVWAYNSGFHAKKSDGSPWGVGWLNNPANPNYPANRPPFLEFSYEDAAHPQDWPYPEKVMGWAGHPVELIETPGNLVPGYRPAYWNGTDETGPLNRQRVKPPVNQFCDASASCQPGKKFVPNAPEVVGEPAGPCAHRNSAGQYDLQCWYNKPSTWKSDCDYSCGNELLRFDPGYAYQEDATSYPPRCTLDGLPSNAQIVDDVPDGVPSIRPNCGRPWTNAGTFAFDFKADAAGHYPGKIDTHQIGGGFGGHFWFTHTRIAQDVGGKLEVNATWKLNKARTGPMRVLVALPDQGAESNLARYVVSTSRGDRVRLVRQPGQGNRWVPIGTFMFDGVPKVRLSSVTPDGTGEQDIAFDAVAFVPVDGTYHEESVEADASFDENQNIDTAAPESWLGGNLASRQDLYDWAVSSANRVLEMPRCDSQVGDCLLPKTEQAVRTWRTQVQQAGLDPVNHPDGNSMAKWIGFANSYQDRPSSDQRPSSFDDDARYKIRTKITVSFVTDPGNAVIPGSEWAVYDHRTGDTHLPQFVLNLFRAVADDYAVYGVRVPNLSYRMANLNVHNGAATSVNPMTTGLLPGRAYATVGKKPVLTTYDGQVSDTGAGCVAVLGNAGGSIGYRPMLSQSGPTSATEDFSDKLADDDRIASPVADVVEDIREMFFDDGLPAAEGALFNVAPPIWHELDFRACADGTIRPVSGRPIFRSSWMPDNYLYHNGRAMGLQGNYSGSRTPVVTGDFLRFSQTPAAHDETPYQQCAPDTGRSGNPWAIGIGDGPGVDPSPARFCLDVNLPGDPGFSNP